MKTILFILICLFIGCGGSSNSDGNIRLWESLPVTIQPLDEDQKEVIEIYNSMFTTPLFEEVESDADITVEIVDELESNLLAITRYYFGEDYLSAVHIEVEKDVSEAFNYQQIFAHELGHSLGSDHMETGIMTLPVRAGDISWQIDEGLTQWIEENYGVERISE